MSSEKLGVAVVCAENRESRGLCAFLKRLQYPATIFKSLEDLEECLELRFERVVILDLDSVPMDNQLVRRLKKRHPDLYLLGISTRPYHPGLEETIGLHFYACLIKPLDWEELEFWLNSIAANAGTSATL